MANTNFADTHDHTDARANRDSDTRELRAPSGRDSTPVALTTRELAMLVEKQARANHELAQTVERQSQQLADVLAVMTAERENKPVQWPMRSATPMPRDLIMAKLAVAADGKPGHLTTTELIAATGLGKSSVHHHVNELLDRGLVVVTKGKRLSSGKRGPDVVYHADAIAV